MESIFFILIGVALGGIILGFFNLVASNKTEDDITTTYDDNHKHEWSRWQIEPKTFNTIQSRVCRICNRLEQDFTTNE